MFIKDNQTFRIKIKNTRNKGFYKKILKEEVKIGDEFDVHWSLLKTSSHRREKIEVSCDGCGKIIKKRLCDLDKNINKHLCASCNKKGERNPAYGKPIHPNTKKGLKKFMEERGNPFTWPEVKEKIREKNPWKIVAEKNTGRKNTPETIKKMRIAAINYIKNKNGSIVPRYNYKACKFFDDLSKEHNWNLRHAENGGEFYIKDLGYFLDAYDKNRNIVVEYDEPQHYKNGVLIKKDKIRQEEIIDLLECKFYRYNEKTREFYGVN
jgi:hypothetical protein